MEDDAFARFREVVRGTLKTGQTAQGDESVDRASYVSEHVLREYWDEAHVNEILYATSELPFVLPKDVIRADYTQTLSIIVYISGKDRSYFHYMSQFIKHEKDDASLPLEERPVFLSDADNDFYNAFYEHQWKFCPVSLGPSSIYDKRIHPQQVLPFSRVGQPVSSRKIGRDTTVYCVKVDPFGQLRVPESSHNLVTLKVFPSDVAVMYHKEIKAYTSLNNFRYCENILRCLGSYHTQSPDGRGDIHVIILENADKGTLLDIYRKNDPPITFEETKTFWKELCGVAFGLEVIHHTPSEEVTGTSIVHQDMKPSNIFAFSRQSDNRGEFNVLLKIGDFGMSHVRVAGSRRRNSQGYDNGSTRTYSPPELHWGDDVPYRVGPLADTWSFGCVLLEAAVWVALGERGRIEFQQRRRLENEKNPRQRTLGRLDSFHNGTTRLEAVADVLNLIERDGRRSDDLTPRIARFILTHVLLGEERKRYNARLLLSNLDTLIDSTELPRRTMSIGCSTGHSPTSREFRRTHSHEHLRSSSGPLHPSNLIPVRSYSQKSPAGKRQAMPAEPTGIHSSCSYGNLECALVSNDSPRSKPWNRYPRTQHPPGFSHIYIASPSSASLPSDMEPYHTARETQQLQGTNLCGFDDKEGNVRTPGRGNRQPSITRVPSIDNNDTNWDDLKHPRARKSHESGNTQQAVQQQPFQPRAPTRARTDDTFSTESTITRDKLQGPSQPLQETEPTFPLLTVEGVNMLRSRGRYPKYIQNLKGQEQAMPWLRNRDHVFIIDNSKSMQEHKKAVIDTFTTLAYILQDADDDGLDVMFTSNWEEMRHDRRTDNLVAFVNNNFDKYGARCFIEKSLHAVITKVIERLPEKEGARRRLVNRLARKNKGRPTSIYILTNGVWDSKAKGVCGADTPIRQLIRELQSRNLHRSQVAIQFIHFGNDERGSERLKWLDDELGKDYPGFDIVDHKDSTGGVWPMLVGSLDEGIDLEVNPSDASNCFH
ncbi:Mitogen-activated protein kinase kinase 1 [Cytospora mali]|uniref:Mitogen-activated protein kinase kinase 1 n=1 Tax=Cytospora mali TaxID=578113 RepID=A0A194VT01_CYTMA|nr:Mitogen-activated protein kinase kinase 1 [Valsa mali]